MTVITEWTTHLCPRCNEKLYREGESATADYVHENGSLFCEQKVIPASK